MAWLRNKKTGGWFEIPDEKLDTNKYMNNKIRNNSNKIKYKNYLDTDYYIKNADNWVDDKPNDYTMLSKIKKVAKSDEEARTIEKYVEDYTNENAYYNYGRINGHINSLGLENASEEIQTRAKLIQKAINGNEMPENIYVYRVVDKNDFKTDSQGTYIQNKGFTSTSAVENTSVDFKDTTDKVKLKIKVEKGTKGLYIGEDTYSIVNEHEILFGLNTRIDIEDIDLNKEIINAKMRRK